MPESGVKDYHYYIHENERTRIPHDILILDSTAYMNKEVKLMPRHKQSDPNSVKSSVIRLRVTEEEAKRFKANAEKAGCKTVSEFIRKMCIDDQVRIQNDNTST